MTASQDEGKYTVDFICVKISLTQNK